MKNLTLIIFTLFSVFTFGQNKPSDFTKIFETELKDWKITFQNFKLEEFEKTETINTKNIENTDKTFSDLSKIDKKFGYFSPNQETFINAFSNLNIELENGKYIASPDIDQSIDFYDIKNKINNTLIFCGSSDGIDEIVYVTEKLVLLVGSKFENENRKPIIYILDINNNVLEKFENTKSIQFKNYKSIKLKEVKI